MDMNGQQAMLTLVKPSHCFESGSFGEIAFESVRPAVVFAAQNASSTALRLHDRICSMSAYIVETINIAIPVLDQKEGDARHGEGHIIAGFGKSQRMGENDPASLENCSAFKFV